jgi:hypothetical protein
VDAATLFFSFTQPKGMKLKFFLPKPKGALPAAPAISVRRKGQLSLNIAATDAIGAEPGESANICYDEEGEQWLLAHWPNGQAGQPQLNAQSGKAKGLRFQCLAAATPLFEKVLADVSTLSCQLDTTALKSEEAPGASLYVLTIPDYYFNATAQASNTPALRATNKQPGVGRGRYDRSASKKGAGRG